MKKIVHLANVHRIYIGIVKQADKNITLVNI